MEKIGETKYEIPDELKVDIKKVLSNINFTDIPIIAILVFHFLMMLCAILVMGDRRPRNIFFMVSMALVLTAGKVGEFLKQNWQKVGFSKDYFDDDEVFLFFFFAVPPLLNCIVLLSRLVGDIGGKLWERHFHSQKEEKEKLKEE